MNKNKKRLSKLLVPMLALSGVAMNNTEAARRSVSVGTKRARYNLEDNYKVKSDKKVLIKNHKIPNGGGSFVIAHGGTAWDEFNEKYELLEQDNYKQIRNKLNIDGIQLYGNGAGAEGTLTKCRNKMTGEIFVVKCVLKIKQNESKGKQKKKIHNDNSFQFYKDSKNPKYDWSRKKWAVKMHDYFSDDKVTYTVTDWIEGETLSNWLEKLKKESNLNNKILKVTEMLKQYLQILSDMYNKGKMNNDLHGKNIMITPDLNENNKFVLKVVDNGAYMDKPYIFDKCHKCDTICEALAKNVSFVLGGEDLPEDEWVFRKLGLDIYKIPREKRNYETILPILQKYISEKSPEFKILKACHLYNRFKNDMFEFRTYVDNAEVIKNFTEFANALKNATEDIKNFEETPATYELSNIIFNELKYI